MDADFTYEDILMASVEMQRLNQNDWLRAKIADGDAIIAEGERLRATYPDYDRSLELSLVSIRRHNAELREALRLEEESGR